MENALLEKSRHGLDLIGSGRAAPGSREVNRLAANAAGEIVSYWKMDISGLFPYIMQRGIVYHIEK